MTNWSTIRRVVTLPVFIVCGSIAMPALAAPEKATAATDDGLLLISGRVLLSDGSPAAGALVESLGEFGICEETVRTDAEGQFELHGLFALSCQLQASSADSRFQTTQRFSPFEARAKFRQPVELKLTPARELVITVRSENKPADGAHVVALGTGGNFRITGVTKRDGSAKLRLPASEKLNEVFAWHPQLGAAGVRELAEAPDRAEIQLNLLAPAPHTIRFVDQDGKAVPNLAFGVTVRAGAEGDWAMCHGIEEAQLRTDTKGEATFSWCPRERKSVFVHFVEGGWKYDEIEQSAAGSEGPTTVHLRREYPVEGRIKLPEGADQAGILITGYGHGPQDHGHRPATRTRSDATFTLPIVSEHGYVLGIADSEWASDGWAGLILADDADKPVEIALDAYPPVPLTVHVTRGPRREPVPNAWVLLECSEREVRWRDAEGEERDARSGVESWLRTDTEGVARAGVGRGELRLRLSTGDWEEERTISVKTGEPVTAAFHRPWAGERRIAGQLMRDGEAYRPSGSVKAWAWSPRERRDPITAEPEVQADGTLGVAIDAEEVAVLVVESERKLSGFARLGPDDAELKLAMEPMAVYGGVAVMENGKPFGGRTLRLRVEGTDFLAAPNVKTDTAGTFHFEAAAGVPLELRVEREPQEDVYFDQLDEVLFLPGEVRDMVRLKVKRYAISDGEYTAIEEKSRPALEDRLAAATHHAHLSGLRTLLYLEGDSSARTQQIANELLDDDRTRELLGYLPVVASSEETEAQQELLAEQNWPKPATEEIVLVAIDGPKTIDSLRIPVGDAATAVELGTRFIQAHEPPTHDARVLLTAAQEEAKQSNKRVWVIMGGPRCGPCFRFAEWLASQRALFEKDYVIVKILGGRDSSTDLLLGDTPLYKHDIPWSAIIEPDGTVLVTSDGPLGNIGFPSSPEGIRHLGEMLQRTARQLTTKEQAEIIDSLTAGD